MSGGVGPESFLWEDVQRWVIPDNSGGGGGGNEEKGAGKKIIDSTTTIGGGKEAEIGGEVVVVTAGSKKRSGISKTTNGKGSEGGGDKVVSEGGKGGGGESDHEIHIWTERERRKKMRNMFSSLHALLPQLPPKADKSTIVDEAVSYIRTLQQTLQNLQKQKLERLHGMTTLNYDPSSSSSSIIMNPQKLAMETTREAFLADQGSSTNLAVAGENSFLIPQFAGLVLFQSWTSPNVTLNVCGEDAHISICSAKKSGLFSAICFVLEKHKLEVVSAHVSSNNCRSMYMIQAHANAADQYPEAFPIEEIYKQAAGEIMLWVNS